MAEQTKKRLKTTDDETWNWDWSEVQNFPIIAIGAMKDNEMKIFESEIMITVQKYNHLNVPKGIVWHFGKYTYSPLSYVSVDYEANASS